MKTVRFLFVLAAVACVPSAAFANGLLYKLPADGTKVVYDMKMEMMAPNRNLTIEGTLSMASVGKAKADGKDCRWIEFHMVMSAMGQERTVTAKVLVPQSELGKGKNPAKHAKRGWVQMRDNEPKEMNDLTSREAGPIPAFLPGPLDEVEKLEATEVKTGAGKMSCKGESGKTSYKQGSGTFVVEYENRLSDKLPFGVAASKIKLVETRNGNTRPDVNITFTYKSTLKNAKSALPDKN